MNPNKKPIPKSVRMGWVSKEKQESVKLSQITVVGRRVPEEELVEIRTKAYCACRPLLVP